MYSMTGFGKAAKIFERYSIKAELRSLNSKQLDLKVRCPAAFREHEQEIRRMVETAVVRGKVDFCLEVDYPEGARGVQVDRGLFLSYYAQLSGLARETGLSSEHLLNTIVRLPNVVSSGGEGVSEQEWEDTRSVIERALAEFLAFREKDGRPIETDMRLRVDLIRQHLLELEPFEADRVERVRQRLRQHLAEWAKVYVDENRLEQELVFYVEKFDLTEEKLRLRQHCDYFLEELLGKDPSKGRKLNFIAQEMGREINTLGSKANAAEIQRCVVGMKDELEKIKEQLANVL